MVVASVVAVADYTVEVLVALLVTAGGQVAVTSTVVGTPLDLTADLIGR